MFHSNAFESASDLNVKEWNADAFTYFNQVISEDDMRIQSSWSVKEQKRRIKLMEEINAVKGESANFIAPLGMNLELTC